MSDSGRSHGGRLALVTLSLILFSHSVAADDSVASFLELELEDLLSMEITSVSKKKEPLAEAPAAVFVITREDIRRSGVTSIPEALRMVPGLQVGKIDSNKWAISSRGFNAHLANKLLVLIDGRSVYTPIYSGVRWEDNDTLLEDIDRIEVIRGPGAALWGANAVNGVINITTRKAAVTRGGLLSVSSGNEEKSLVGLRYGRTIGEHVDGRVHAKYTDRDSSFSPVLGRQAGDDWTTLQGGFRIDGQSNSPTNWTVQGDFHQSSKDEITADLVNPSLITTNTLDMSRWNLLGRRKFALSETSLATLQIYFDHYEATQALLIQEHDTLDIDFQHQIAVNQRTNIVWGLGYRRIDDDLTGSFAIALQPEQRSTELSSAFFQGEFELSPDVLRLTVGSKFEHNSYTGFEVQPSVRLLWLPRERQTLWASVSRAVRTPSRLEDSSRVILSVIEVPSAPPIVITLTGNGEVDSEVLTASELGYRIQPTETLSLDFALFHNDYDKLTTIEEQSAFARVFANRLSASSYGLESAVDWRPREWWRLSGSYSYIEISGRPNVDSNDEVSPRIVEGSSPKHQLSLRSAMDLRNNFSLDLWAYYVAALDATALLSPVAIPSYSSFNLRVGWQPTDSLSLSLVGHNVLTSRHREFVGEGTITGSEVERSIYAQVLWSF